MRACRAKRERVCVCVCVCGQINLLRRDCPPKLAFCMVLTSKHGFRACDLQREFVYVCVLHDQIQFCWLHGQGALLMLALLNTSVVWTLIWSVLFERDFCVALPSKPGFGSCVLAVQYASVCVCVCLLTY